MDGTTVISFVLRPENGMEAVVDCVGILKERNVDVEHKLQRLKGKKGNGGESCEGQIIPGITKKRSTKCRLVFKCDLSDGLLRGESLTAISQPLVCTQPAGCPEVCYQTCLSTYDLNQLYSSSQICKKSLSRCEIFGGKGQIYLPSP